jgi:hypothetical protein
MMKKIITIATVTFLFVPLFSYAQTPSAADSQVFLSPQPTANTPAPLTPFPTNPSTQDSQVILSPQVTTSPTPTTPPNTTTLTIPNKNATPANGNLSYTPLEPLPCIGTSCSTPTDLPSYLAIIFKILIVVGALMAVGALAVSGVTMMFSEVSSNLTAAKSRAQAAVWGLVIIAASYLFLQTINPQLVSFNFNPGTVAVAGATPSLFSQQINQCLGADCVSATQAAADKTVASGQDSNPTDVANAVKDQLTEVQNCNNYVIPNCTPGVTVVNGGYVSCKASTVTRSLAAGGSGSLDCSSPEATSLLQQNGYTNCSSLTTNGICMY